MHRTLLSFLLVLASITSAQESPEITTTVERNDGNEVELKADGNTPDSAVEIPMTFEDELTVIGREADQVAPMIKVETKTVVMMPGAGEDVLQTLRAMPGVVSVDDWSSRLFVRGGRPDQNGIYLDGISIYDPYRLFGLTSLFNPETVESIEFYPGGFDVQYGDRLSAVIAVENRTGTIDRKIAGSANVSLTNTNLVAEGRISENVPSSWLVSARRTYYDLVANQVSDTDSQYPSFTDFQTRLLYQPAAAHRFTVTLLAYDEGTDLLEEEDPDFGEVDDRIKAVDDQKGYVAGLNGEHRFGTRSRLSYVLAATHNEQVTDVLFSEGETSFESSIDQDLTGDVYSLRSSFEVFFHDHTLQVGMEAAQSENTVTFHFRTDDPRIPIPDSLLDFDEGQDFRKYAFFAQDTWHPTERLAIKGGLRWDRSTLADLSSTSPRISARYNLSPAWQLRAAWGHYTQFASYESLQGDGYFLDLRGIKELGLEPEKAIHSLLGFTHMNPRGWKIAFDLYHKELDDILQSGEELETILILDGNDETMPYSRNTPTFIPENTRSGYAQGAELTFTLLERPDRPYYGMLNYTFGQAETEDDHGWTWENYDQRHAVTVFGGMRFGKYWEVGMRWRYASGFPTTPLINVIRVVEDIDGDGEYDPEVDWFTYQRDESDESINSDRLPTYHRLDLRLQYARTFGRIHSTFYLDVINAYARKNAVGYIYNQDYSERDIEEGMPLLPSIGVKIEF